MSMEIFLEISSLGIQPTHFFSTFSNIGSSRSDLNLKLTLLTEEALQSLRRLGSSKNELMSLGFNYS